MPFPLLNSYFTHDVILKKLISMRCANAEAYQKKFLVKSLVGKQDDIEPPEDTILYEIFPGRKHWVHIGEKNRAKVGTQRKKNERNLWLTIKKEAAKETHADWYNHLEQYIEQIIQKAKDSSFTFGTPKTFGVEKKRKHKEKIVEVRPICQFVTVEERIIVSVYNRILTQLFDPYFYERSYAFRDMRKLEKSQLQHVRAIDDIVAFRKKHPGELWVAECDIKKFFDTIDHKQIKFYFDQLLYRAKRENSLNNEDYKQLKHIMYSYIECYSFYQNIYQYNDHPRDPFWKCVKSKGYAKRVEWVEEDIKQAYINENAYPTEDYYKYHLGIPQGGALSGLIANIVMHFVDIILRRYYQRDDFLYIRFCDDMIMMCPDKEFLSKAFNKYKAAVRHMHLYIHDDTPMEFKHMRDFWKGKTRAPYPWGAPGKMDIMPWITFVGFDISWEGDVRIRRSTYRNEIEKQYKKVQDICKLFGKKEEVIPLRSREFIMESVLNRMIGMSVGRVKLWNYTTFENEMSWASAFKAVTDNKYTRHELRNLDRHRNLMLARLRKSLKGVADSGAEKDEKPKQRKKEQDIFYGKPYSYYYQVLKSVK